MALKPANSARVRSGSPNLNRPSVENQAWGDLGQRNKDKCPLLHARMRKAKPRAAHSQVIEEQEIDVNRPGSLRSRAHTAEFPFD